MHCIVGIVLRVLIVRVRYPTVFIVRKAITITKQNTVVPSRIAEANFGKTLNGTMSIDVGHV